MLRRLQIENFRCIEQADLVLHPRGTGIVGGNGSGKTSLLEAIYFLGHLRSFRTMVRERLLRRSESSLRLVGFLENQSRTVVAGVEYSRTQSQIRLGGLAVPAASIAAHLPMQIIDPGIHRVIEEGSARRRRMMDWGVFHVEPQFLSAWQRYSRALRQRNAALRSRLPTFAWDAELTSSVGVLDDYRRLYINRLAPVFEVLAGDLLDTSASLEYRRGWSLERDLASALDAASEADRRQSTTTVGAHRADLVFKVDGRVARECISRGQQKLLAAAFVLAQIRVRQEDRAESTCLLLDDPAAELDVDNLGKLLAAISAIPSQLIVTSIHSAGLRGLEIGQTFHVERGKFTPML